MLASLHANILAALRAELDLPLTTVELTPLSGGACQENFRVDVSPEPSPAGDQVRADQVEDTEPVGALRFVLRSDAKSALPASLSRRAELAVIQVARRLGVRTPRAFGLAEGLVRPGASSYFMDWVEGEAIGAKVLRDPQLEGARRELPETLAAELAKIHRVTPRTDPELPIPNPGSDPARSAVDAQRRALVELPDRHHPALELAIAWLDEHRPPPPPEVTLVHGDFRTGNFLIHPRGVEAILDWEFAHFGDPIEDLGWLTVRDWRFGQLRNAAGGFASRARFFSAYEAASGRRVSAEAAHFWEVLGNVRWAIGAIVQGQRYLEGKESDLELIAIGRRAQEMEYEALRLIERGAISDKEP